MIPKDELKDHNCIRELRSMILSQQVKIAEFKTDITDQNITINELKRELQMFSQGSRWHVWAKYIVWMMHCM